MGLPKGVMLTHYNMVANACQFDKFDLKLLNWELDAQLGVLPFFHIYVSCVLSRGKENSTDLTPGPRRRPQRQPPLRRKVRRHGKVRPCAGLPAHPRPSPDFCIRAATDYPGFGKAPLSITVRSLVSALRQLSCCAPESRSGGCSMGSSGSHGKAGLWIDRDESCSFGTDV